MSDEKEYFADFRPRLIIPALIWLGCIIAAIVIALQLSGCATADESVWHRVCYEQPLGQTEKGILVVQHSCVTLEAFKAAQK